MRSLDKLTCRSRRIFHADLRRLTPLRSCRSRHNRRASIPAECRGRACIRARAQKHRLLLASRTLAINRHIRVWNGIFATGDWHAKRGLKAMSPRRDRKSETTTPEKWPQNGFSAGELSVAGFGRLGGGRTRMAD